MAKKKWKDLKNECIENFDFDKVFDVMRHLNWVWFNTENGLPTEDELVSTLEYAMDSAIKQVKALKKSTTQPSFIGFSGTGGFEAEAIEYTDDKSRYLTVRFVVTDWQTNS